MNTKTRRSDSIRAHLENVGGIWLAICLVAVFIGYIWLAPLFPKSVIIIRLQTYGSTAQVVAVFAVICIALLSLGVRKMLFKLKETRQIETIQERLTALEADVASVKEENVTLRAENKEKDALINKLISQQRPNNEPPSTE